jgi:hypothetical protein
MMRFTQEEIVLESATRDQADAAAPLMYDTDPHFFHLFLRWRPAGHVARLRGSVEAGA